jgi:hypothetical protein
MGCNDFKNIAPLLKLGQTFLKSHFICHGIDKNDTYFNDQDARKIGQYFDYLNSIDKTGNIKPLKRQPTFKKYR